MEDFAIEIQPWGGTISAVAMFAIAAYLVFSLFRSAHALPRKGIAAIMFFRFAALAMLALPLFRLGIAITSETTLKQPLTIAIDTSRSMELRATNTSPSRAEIIAMLLDQSSARFAQLSDKYDIDWRRFDVLLAPYNRSDPSDGPATAIGDAIENWRSSLGPGTPGALLILSDGCNNKGIDPAKAASSLKLEARPIFAIGIGEKGDLDALIDASVEDLILPTDANSDQRFAVEAVTRFIGLGGVEVDVEVYVNGKIIEVKQVQINAQNQTSRVSFDLEPLTAGNHLVTVKVKPIGSEANIANNEMSAYLKVRRGIGRILMVESRLRYEYLFLKRTLSSIAGLEFDTMILRGLNAETKIPVEKWQQYDLIILGDVPAHLLGSKHLEAIANCVTDGASLLTLGGLSAYGIGGYDSTPLSRVLPFAVSNVDEQSNEPILFLPTVEGFEREYLKFFSDEETYGTAREKFTRMPKLSGYCGVGIMKPTASLLAQSDTGKPLMVSYESGSGRTISLLVDTTYHWAFNAMRQEADTLPIYKRFWRRLALNLVGARNTDEYRVELSTEITSVRTGEKLPFRLDVTDKDKRPVPDVDVQAVVKDIDGKETIIRLRSEDGYYTGTFTPQLDGHYTIIANAKKEGRILGSDELKILATIRDRETSTTETDFALLSSLASMSGGFFAEWGKADTVFVSLMKRAEEHTIVSKRHSPMWSNPLVFLIAVLFLTIEWILRRRKGLP